GVLRRPVRRDGGHRRYGRLACRCGDIGLAGTGPPRWLRRLAGSGLSTRGLVGTGPPRWLRRLAGSGLSTRGLAGTGPPRWLRRLADSGLSPRGLVGVEIGDDISFGHGAALRCFAGTAESGG